MHWPALRLGPMTDLPGRKECGAQDDVADKDQEAGGDGDGHQRKVFHKFKLYNFFHVRHGHPRLSWCFRCYSLQERSSLGRLCLPGCLRRLLCVLHCPVKVDNIPQNIIWSLLGTPSTASTHPSETILPAHPAVAGDGAPAIISKGLCTKKNVLAKKMPFPLLIIGHRWKNLHLTIKKENLALKKALPDRNGALKYYYRTGEPNSRPVMIFESLIWARFQDFKIL